MHPFVKILYFVLILFLMSFMSNQLLYILALIISVFAAGLQLRNFLRIIKRMRWLFFSILIIYAFATPGQLIPDIPVNFAPTFEGIQQGLLQVVKLLIALAALTLLFVGSSKEQLILGMYMLLKPLKHLGLNVEKFAVRLFLTLDYVEDFAVQNQHKFTFSHFDTIYLAAEDLPVNKTVTFTPIPFKKIDKLMIAILAVIIMTLTLLELQS